VAPIDAERRHRMIAETAYYKAKNRGFGGGRDMQDWLLAEQEFERARKRRCGYHRRRAAADVRATQDEHRRARIKQNET